MNGPNLSNDIVSPSLLPCACIRFLVRLFRGAAPETWTRGGEMGSHTPPCQDHMAVACRITRSTDGRAVSGNGYRAWQPRVVDPAESDLTAP